MQESIFDKLDFGPMRPLLDNDDITDISYCNGGQIWIRSLTQGSLRVEIPSCTPEFMEKLAFQCSNVMGTTFNNAKPFLDAESSELRLNFVHDSIATNGIACVIRKTPAKIRLEKEKLLKEDYFTADIHDILIKCVEGHCNIIVAGETGSGKTEFVKYLASHTRETEKIITIEDTLELHLDKIFPKRDIVAMKTNNVASYTDVLVTCMRQNPKWILLSEVRSAEAVMSVRNSISSGHNILSTIHADKASAIPYRLYSLMETDIDVNQFLTTIYRYIQLGVHIKAYYSKKYGKFHREVDEVVEFYVDEDNQPKSHTIYRKVYEQEPIMNKPSPHLIEYLENQNVDITNIVDHIVEPDPLADNSDLEDSGDGTGVLDVSADGVNGEIAVADNIDSEESTNVGNVESTINDVQPVSSVSENTSINDTNIASPIVDNNQLNNMDEQLMQQNNMQSQNTNVEVAVPVNQEQIAMNNPNEMNVSVDDIVLNSAVNSTSDNIGMVDVNATSNTVGNVPVEISDPVVMNSVMPNQIDVNNVVGTQVSDVTSNFEQNMVSNENELAISYNVVMPSQDVSSMNMEAVSAVPVVNDTTSMIDNNSIVNDNVDIFANNMTTVNAEVPEAVSSGNLNVNSMVGAPTYQVQGAITPNIDNNLVNNGMVQSNENVPINYNVEVEANNPVSVASNLNAEYQPQPPLPVVGDMTQTGYVADNNLGMFSQNG